MNFKKQKIKYKKIQKTTDEIYEFFWSKFCDVYIEECKKSGETDNLRPMLKEILVMMHPFAPFITEEIHTLLFKNQIIEQFELAKETSVCGQYHLLNKHHLQK